MDIPGLTPQGTQPPPATLIHPLSLAMTEADNTMGADSKEAKSRLEDIKYYTSLFLGTLCIVCVFGFLFLVPFVLDPAISTLMHDFVQSPVHCKVTEAFEKINWATLNLTISICSPKNNNYNTYYF